MLLFFVYLYFILRSIFDILFGLSPSDFVIWNLYRFYIHYCLIRFFLIFFFFKQKTAYEMRISDWSSDVCSSDLRAYFKDRSKAFIEQMKKLDSEIKLALAEIPENKRKVVSSHDALGYFSQAYGVHFVSVAGLSSQAEPSRSAGRRVGKECVSKCKSRGWPYI